ncbi:MAG: 4Fe-4S dicluster domain-containing protein [Syntrophomonadaceae bacterium]|nr:4Fe-4S dicluster domain-containing protein [Syntrophomonadaceae bacterium]
MAITRRSFLKRAAVSSLAAASIATGVGKAAAQVSPNGSLAMLHDLNKCDGCELQDTPQCVLACRTKNAVNFPQPQQPIKDYWPQPKHEDWSKKQHITNRLTPYNWTYVQNLEVEHEGQKIKVHVPRKCMHCDNPPCSKLCPFGVNDKTVEGPVVIDTNGCFGGAKCRDVCPWHIPQRQAGVGLYLDVAPDYAGGGVMYKCDMCYDLVKQGREPACVSACPRGAIKFGPQEELRQYALDWAKENDGYVYGVDENGGTANFYISRIPFDTINDAIMEQDFDGKNGRVGMPVNIENSMNEPGNMLSGFLLAPLAGVLAAGISTYQIMKGGSDDEDKTA